MNDEIRQPEAVLNGDQLPTDGTHCIIAGSRSAVDGYEERTLKLLIDGALEQTSLDVDAVISGTASGIDQVGEQWATERDIPVGQFPAPWDDIDRPDAVVRDGKYGKYDAKAGYRRNRWMAEYVAAVPERGVLLAIIDYPSNGTESMIELGRDILGDENVFVIPLGGIDDDEVRAELEPVIV